jgi:O-antigen chain-terminating methyltransferase
MRTEEKQYSDYLEAKYLPGRSLYLRWFFYPKLFRAFPGADAIVDLGCGTGEFLRECRRRKRNVIGIDSNETLVDRCRKEGFKVEIDDLCELASLKGQRFKYAVCDNVLEHLEVSEITQFFERVESLLLRQGKLICVVPGRMGFKKDPTHKTYVSPQLVNELLKGSSLRANAFYYHPLNFRHLDDYFYLNMRVLTLTASPENSIQNSKSPAIHPSAGNCGPFC